MKHRLWIACAGALALAGCSGLSSTPAPQQPQQTQQVSPPAEKPMERAVTAQTQPPAPSKTQARIQESRNEPIREAAAAEPPPPPPRDGKDAIKTRDRYITVTAKVRSAEETYAQIKSDSAQLGQQPNPEISTAFHRMRAALDSAQRELDAGKIEDARESLDLAEASAAKVLRAGGGR